MAAGPKVEQTGEWYQQFGALIVVVLFASVGGILIQIMSKGVRVETGTVNFSIKPLLTKIQIPPLVGMIIFGCLARNFFAQSYMQHYPENTASWIRMICLSIILLRGGLELDFKGKGLTVVLLTLCPQFSEAVFSGLASRWIFGLPWALCFANGFTLGAVSPAVLVPSLMILQKAGYGVKKGIPTTLIAASSFDDIIAITVFGIFLTIGVSEAPGQIFSDEEESPLWLEVGFNVLQIVVGLILGLFIGWCMKVFNKFHGAWVKWAKFGVCVFMALLVPIGTTLALWPEAKFICIIFFGYQCYMQWGEEKPEHELALLWRFCQPFLFGTVGAAVIFAKVDASQIGLSLIIIVIGVTARWIGTFLAASEKKYVVKEKAFMAFAWIPKATVQAALGGMTLAELSKRGVTDPQYIEWGNQMLTCAVLAICITAPAGAIMINTLGTKWLTYDGEESSSPV